MYSRYFIVCEWYGSHMSCGQWCERRGVEMDETKPLHCIVSPVQEEKRGNACIYASVYFICFCASLPPSPTSAAARHLFRCLLYSATCWTIRVQFSAVGSVFFSYPKRPDRFGVSHPPPPCLVGSGSCFPKDKRSECIADNSHPSSAQV